MIKKFIAQLKPNWLICSLLILTFIISQVQRVNCAETVDRIVAIVNDDIIRLVELNKAFAPIEQQIKAQHLPTEKEKRVLYDKRMETLNNLIDDKLTEQEINRVGITILDSEIDNAIQQVKSYNMYSQEDLERVLSASGLNMADYRKEIKKQILRNKLVNLEVTSNIVVTKSDIQKYYNDHLDNYAAKKKYKLGNILMAYPEDDGDRNAVFDKMTKVLERLIKGDSFEEMAKEYSEGVNADDGGNLGLFSINDLADNIKKAVSPLKAGQFSSIVGTDQGYQIFYVEDITEIPGKSVEDASDEIRQKLYEDDVNKKFKSWIEDLRKDAHIKILY